MRKNGRPKPGFPGLAWSVSLELTLCDAVVGRVGAGGGGAGGRRDSDAAAEKGLLPPVAIPRGSSRTGLDLTYFQWEDERC